MSLVTTTVIWLVAAIPAPLQDLFEPSDLAKRPDLVGREITVDDRIRYFLQSKPRGGYDELLLRRTEVLFRLPPRLKFVRSPFEPNARIRGTLKIDDGRLVCDVETLDLLPNDPDRLERELTRLRPDDFEGKRSWASWAERRGKELNDPKLEARGVVLEAEALWAEADRPGANPLKLAERAADRPIPAGIRNALAHRGFRSILDKLSRPPDLDDLARRIEATLPDSTRASPSEAVDPAILDSYGRDPASVYRDASQGVRSVLDRRLLADAIQKSLERQLEERPTDAIALAVAAREKLPDRASVADRIRQTGLADAESRAPFLRQSEVEDLARTFRSQGDEARALRVLRSWLDDRRKNRLSSTDSEGRVLLAANYEKLTGDKATAADLLREALAIDPQSRAVTDAFLRMGFRKGDAGWFDPADKKAGSPDSVAGGSRKNPDRDAIGEAGDALKGLTRNQVRSRLGGNPDQIFKSATQGRYVEQWIFRSGKRVQIFNFLTEPGTMEARVTSHYLDQ